MTEAFHDDLVQKLARRYTAGAAGYAEHWAGMLGPMNARLLDFLPLSGVGRILDVGCGPGTLAEELGHRNESASIVGIDRSSGMLAQAPAHPRSRWCLMDGRRLAFAARSFDAALLAFVLFHFPDMPDALRQVRRVLRPGGFVGIATFHSTPSFEARRIWQESLANLSPPHPAAVVDLSAVDCVDQTDRPEKLSALLKESGFHSTRTTTEQFEHEWDPANYLSLLTTFGSSGAAYRSLSRASQDRLRTTIRQRFEQLPRTAFHFSPTVLYATARRPR